MARHQESCVCMCVWGGGVVFVCAFCVLCLSREDWEQFVRGHEASLSTYVFFSSCYTGSPIACVCISRIEDRSSNRSSKQVQEACFLPFPTFFCAPHMQ